MIEPVRTKPALITVATRNVVETLDGQELYQAFMTLLEKMKTPDPANPNLWTSEIQGRPIWGILDEGAGPQGEDMLTLMFPEDY